jgi:hypothetical protein
VIMLTSIMMMIVRCIFGWVATSQVVVWTHEASVCQADVSAGVRWYQQGCCLPVWGDDRAMPGRVPLLRRQVLREM